MPTDRARDLGLPFPGTTGPHNAITDVSGVRVGYTTLTDADNFIRTGVTAIIPRSEQNTPTPVWAGHYSLNGNGEMTGTHHIDDAGYFCGPVCITNTHSVGAVHHGATQWMIKNYASFFTNEHAWAMPVVAETYDGVLNDINAMAVTAEHTIEALESASSGSVTEGAVGGGNGMIAFEFKGGTGTASRVIAIGDDSYTVGALVQANHGERSWLNLLGVPVGQHLTDDQLYERESGSIIVVLATDAPLSSVSLNHLARRAAIGIGRSGTPGGNSSGDIFLAFSVADPQPLPQFADAVVSRRALNADLIDSLYLAGVEAVDEAIINALIAGRDTPTFKPRGKTCVGIDHEAVKTLMRTYGRMPG